MRRPVLLAAALVPLAACASGGGPQPGTAQPAAATAARPRTNDRLISLEEIRDARLSDTHALVQRLRPRWLRVRGSDGGSSAAQDVVVYRDGVRLGYSNVLRGLTPEGIFQIRYFDSIGARTQYGVGHEQGVILLVTTATR